MGRTNNIARKGLAGKEFRDNQKRKREEAAGAESHKRKGNFPSAFQELDRDRPSKKAKSTTDSHQEHSKIQPTATAAVPQVQGQPQNITPFSVPAVPTPTTYKTPPQIIPPVDITPSHQTTHISILSSSKIQKKVKSTLSILSTFSFSDPSPHVVLLSARSNAVNKLIGIAEIVKRELAKNGKKWYQYNVLAGLENIVPRKTEVEEEEKGEDVEMEDDEEAFETMKTPFERALDAEGRPKIKCIATVTLYLSRVRIESLKRTYGYVICTISPSSNEVFEYFTNLKIRREQTNAST